MVVAVIPQRGIEEIRGRNPRETHPYLITGTTDRHEARWELIQNTPSVSDTFLLRSSAKLRELSVGTWAAELTYGVEPMPSAEAGAVKFTASTKGGSERVTQSLATVDSASIEGRATPDFHRAIGVGRGGEVAGVQVVVPKATFSLEAHIEYDLFDELYQRKLYFLTGVVNSKKFRGLAPGECQFLGFDSDGEIALAGDQDSSNLVRIRFDFAVSENALYDENQSDKFPGVQVEGISRPVSKRGFDYLWIRYEEFVDEATKIKTKRPVDVFVEQVHKMGSFSVIGL